MTVSELITLLQTFPGDAPAGVLTVAQSGLVIDIDTAPVLTVEQTIADDGTVEAVWLTGAGDAEVPAPRLITWPCGCGGAAKASAVRWCADERPRRDGQRRRPSGRRNRSWRGRLADAVALPRLDRLADQRRHRQPLLRRQRFRPLPRRRRRAYVQMPRPER